MTGHAAGPSTDAAEDDGGMAHLLVVSNRLPVTMTRDDSANGGGGGWTFKMSSGGLVSALSGLKKNMRFTWIGWPGLDVPAEEQDVVTQRLLDEHSCMPVFIKDDVADLHYNGFSNSILWPLFHYLPGEINFQERDFQAYVAVNQAFADAVARIVHNGDSVWVQDYHLMLMPEMLRTALPPKVHVRIGFFLHTPFPSSEVYRILPVRKQVLTGLLHCDLIGFHTYDYARHFLSSCTRILSLQTAPNGVEYEGRFVEVGAFPVGIEPEKFEQGLQQESIRDRVSHLRAKFRGKRIIVGVDRLDYIKGVPQKLHAFEVFLRKHPEFKEQVVLIQIAVPTRVDVDEYKHLRANVNEMVGSINGQYGTTDFMPIHFLNKSVNFEELCALYAAADVCLVTSTRDGMNLSATRIGSVKVSYEYVACQEANHGVLILSEFAGAAQSLYGAKIVNPWNTEDMALAIYEALTLPADVRAANQAKLLRYVRKHTAAFWGASFVAELKRASEANERRDYLPRLNVNRVRELFARAQRLRVLFLDYDGTLARTQALPEFAAPPPSVLTAVRRLCAVPRTLVYIVCGRDRANLDKWFLDTGAGLAAEHGCFYRHPVAVAHLLREDGTTADGRRINMGWVGLADDVDLAWRDTIMPFFRYYTERTPGSFIEEKEINVTWHYRNADPEFGEWQASELQMNLGKILAHMPISVVSGSKYLEVRPAAVDKGTVIRTILADINGPMWDEQAGPDGVNVDFCMAIGDGRTDETVFKLLERGRTAITVAVGRKKTEAKAYLDSVDDVRLLLTQLPDASALATAQSPVHPDGRPRSGSFG